MEWGGGGARGWKSSSYQRRQAPGWECTLSEAQFTKQLNSESWKGVRQAAMQELSRQTRGEQQTGFGGCGPSVRNQGTAEERWERKT